MLFETNCNFDLIKIDISRTELKILTHKLLTILDEEKANFSLDSTFVAHTRNGGVNGVPM